MRSFREHTEEKIQITSCYWERFFFLHGTSTSVALGPVNPCHFWVAVLNLMPQWPHSRSREATGFNRLSVTTWVWVLGGEGGVVKFGDSYLFCKQAGPEILRFWIVERYKVALSQKEYIHGMYLMSEHQWDLVWSPTKLAGGEAVNKHQTRITNTFSDFPNTGTHMKLSWIFLGVERGN